MDHAESVSIAELLDERRYLLDVAYWMLGSTDEAEWVVGETYRRWYALSDAKRHEIPAPRAWLAKIAGGICLNRLALPDRDLTGADEEHLTRAGAAAKAQAGLENEVSRVLLDALDTLSPAERAAFVLNDVFGMTLDAVADIVGRTEPETTDLADRAREQLRGRRSRPVSSQRNDTVARALRHACVTQDAVLLASLLCTQVTAFFDGGGKVRALTRPVHGREQVAHSLLTFLACRPRTDLAVQSVNGRTGLVVRYHDQVAAVISLDIDDQRITQVWVVLNPDKLRSWNQPANPAPGARRSLS
ncbi:RNA polymerase sigma factor [Streptomyces sp. AS58]|uniref:sigma factor-like helix-turn-helix DNA-binding protein n=1 Tax=Streptomyces sp. AS58 TaxID=1519489 RepID=UPI0006AE0962|nr:sigma factor-like helix-turn-helix DNA-binding protein [Streptomyces sp. AS58]KOV52700.1 RNA polymerase sigma factor [Streptomyces sp. AS58]